MVDPMEISTISSFLKELTEAKILLPEARKACAQATALLTQMREVTLTPASDEEIVKKLKWILAQQGEG